MSRFISSGTSDEPAERDGAWLRAQSEIEAKRLQTKLKPGEQEGGKSLYETLQANKGDTTLLSPFGPPRLTSQDLTRLKPRSKTPSRKRTASGTSSARSTKMKWNF